MQALAHSLGCRMEPFSSMSLLWGATASLLCPRSTAGSWSPPRELISPGWPCPQYQRCALLRLSPESTMDALLQPPVPPLDMGLYTYDTQQIDGGWCLWYWKPEEKRCIYIHCQCREVKCAKFWLITCTENSENAIIIASYTILPEDATTAICTSSGKLVIISTWPEDKLLTK